MLSCVFWNQIDEITHTITCVHTIGQKIFTGSETGEICLWENQRPFMILSSSSQSPCLYLSSVSSPNKSLLSCKEILISIHKDLKIRTWDSEDGRCLNSHKLSDSFDLKSLNSSQSRLFIIQSSHLAMIFDAWTLSPIKTLHFGSVINSSAFLQDSKIVILTQESELIFWSYTMVHVQELPYFVLKFLTSYEKVSFDEESKIICIKRKDCFEFRKMSDIKFDNYEIGVIYNNKAKDWGFYKNWFFIVTTDNIIKYKIQDIIDLLDSCTCFKIIKELEIDSTQYPIITTPTSKIIGDKLISYKNSHIEFSYIESFPLNTEKWYFHIDKSEIPCLNPNETVTYSSIVLQKWPLMLIGTSTGRILLKSLSSDKQTLIYNFHNTSITCIKLCKDSIVSCNSDAVLCIYHPDRSRGFCDLLSPAMHIHNVSCIQDTIHNISDIFWKNSWKNWDETILVHCQDQSISLVSLVTNSVICSFSTKISHVSEVLVHVLLEYLLIRSHEVVYVFNMMMQCLERVAVGVSANELLRKPILKKSCTESNSPEDMVCEEHKTIEVNWRSCAYNRKIICSGEFNIQGTANPIISFGDEIDDELKDFVLSILTCWDNGCSSHKTLVKIHPEMSKIIYKSYFGIKGDTWQSYYLMAGKKTNAIIDTLILTNIMKISSIGCSLIKPSIGCLVYKSLAGNSFLLRIVRDLTTTITESQKVKLIAACKNIIHLRTPTSAAIRKAIGILGSLKNVHIENEWTRSKSSLAECQASIILAYFITDLNKEDSLYVITSLLSMIRCGNPFYAAAACKAISHTFSIWKNYISTRIKGIIKELIFLSNSEYQNVYFKTIGALTVNEMKSYVLMIAEEVSGVENPTKKLWMNSLKWMVTYKYDTLASFLPMILEVILKTLNPHSPAIRKVYLDQAGEILQMLVLKLPMVAFSQAKQKIAVGTTDSTIMIYDLKTAAFWKCLEGHEGPVSAVVFNKTGDILASYSAQDLSVKLWKIEIGFFQGLVGFKTIKPYNSIPLSDVKRTACNYKEFIECISFQWKDQIFKLTREDARSYSFHI
ncbi:hypothetical protein SteCoe_11420 [Stentor coeruleus]|uniref:Uncharacterized protein n=1 Tax=Stentor coeruleus TaxID=5963 RepID=A0A1R2CD71_9CILI|nr:hypothetical protein SteCoe_11420 [Stentor coeruleus]